MATRLQILDCLSQAVRDRSYPLGETLAERFEVKRRLGEGGMGVVYEALDRQRGERVALKTLERLDGAAVYRLKNEFRSIADISHPNLVRLHELCADGERWFFTMACIDGVPFVDHVRGAALRGVDPLGATAATPTSVGPIDVEAGTVTASGAAASELRERELRRALAGLAAGVRAIHRAGKLHRDLKPQNVLVDANGKAIILDFGLASPVDERQRDSDLALAGTPAYMAPEQLRGAPCPASDWYAVGAMLYEALAGRLPFEGDATAIMGQKHLGRAPAPLRSVAPHAPADLADLAMALLRTSPEERPGEDEILATVGVAADSQGASASSKHPFVGRIAELEALRKAFDRVRGGAPRVVHVAGVSGIGKTALIERFLEEVSDEAEVLRGRCYEREAVPFKALDAIVDALSRRLRDAGTVGAARLTPRSTTELCRLFPVLERVPAFAQRVRASATPDPNEARRKAFLALKETFARLGEERPVVLFIDDLQWGDVDSATFLLELTAPPDPPRLLLLGSYRADEVDRSALLKVLRDHAERSQGHQTITLEPLDASVAHELATALLGPERDHELAREVAAEAQGSPFFLSHLARAGGVTRGTTLAEVISREVSALSPEAQALLGVVALAAGPVRRDVALSAMGLTVTNDEAIPELTSAALLRSSGPGPDDTVETYHDRIREVVAAALPAERCRHHHLALATALERLPSPPAAKLALHYREAGERAPARRWAIEAARLANRALAFDQAAEHCRQALAFSTDDEAPAARRQLERMFGEALASAGRGLEAARVFEAAARGAPEAESLDLERMAAYELLHAGDIEQGMARARRLLARTGFWLPTSPLIAAVLLLVFMRYFRWRGFVSRARSDGACDPATLASIDLAWSIAGPLALADPVRAGYLGSRALFLARKVGDAQRIGKCAGAAYAMAVAIDPSQDYSKQRASIVRYSDEHAISIAKPQFVLADTMIGFLSGDFRPVPALAREAERMLEPLSESAGVSFARAYRIWALSLLGEVREVSEQAPSLARGAKERGNRWLQGAMQTVHAAVGRLVGDHGELAAREIDEWAASWPYLPPVQKQWLLDSHGLVDLYLGRPRELLLLVEREWPGVRRSGVMRLPFIAADLLDVRCRALLAVAATERDEGERHRLARSVIGQANQLAALRVGHAAALGSCARAGASYLLGDGDDSGRLLEEAVGRFDALGMQLHAACARRRLGALRRGAGGEALIAEGDRFMRAQTIVRPDRFTAMLAPGFDEA